MSQIAQQFQQAVNALQRQQFAEAERIASQLDQQSPNHPDVLHLLALATKQTEPQRAFNYFQRSLAVNPQQPNVLSNFANLLQASKQWRAAKKHYVKALQLNPKLVDSWYNLASLHYQSGDYLAASHAATKAIQLQPEALKAVVLLARAELDYKRFDKAQQVLERALQQWPDEPSLLFNLALVYRFTERTEQARQILQSLEGKLAEAQRQFQLGCLSYDEGDYSQSEQHMQRAIALQNDLIAAHEALNKLYWEHDQTDKFLSSIQQSLKQQPDSLALAYSYLSHLYQADRKQEANEQLDQWLNQFGEPHSLLHLKGVAEMQAGHLASAARYFERVLAQEPRHPRYLIDSANILLRQGHYDEAFKQLELAHENQPLNQEVHAYKGLCWKLSGQTEKAQQLNDYQQYVKVGYPPAPEGYDSIEAFWPHLVARVEQLHKTQHQPLDQSVRGGTQTVGSLLSIDDPIIQAYKQSLQQYIEDYLDSLPNDNQHPVAARKTDDYHFSGSWSVKLFKEGFHTNHVHPEGWLSLCTYLTVPDEVDENDPQRKGWIKFGETSLGLGEDESIDLAVCPKPGMCVIFPSFCWHGTVAFDSDAERMTIPCDIMPS